MSTAELLSTLISQLTAGQRPQELAEGAKRTPSEQLQTAAQNVIRDEVILDVDDRSASDAFNMEELLQKRKRKEKATPAQQMFAVGIYIRPCS